MSTLDISMGEERDEAGMARRFIELVRRTDTASPAAEDVQALREMMGAVPGLWRTAGDLAQRTTLRLIEQASSSAAVRESMIRGAAELREGLESEGAPVLERVVIEQVVLCWARLNLFEQVLTEEMEHESPQDAVRFWEERVANAQRQFLRASECLARIRRLARTRSAIALIHIAERQVNIAQVGAVEPPA